MEVPLKQDELPIEIANYIIALKEQLQKIKLFIQQPKLSILSALCDKLLYLAELSKPNILCIVTHLSAINHYIKLANGESLFVESKRYKLEELIAQGYKIIDKYEYNKLIFNSKREPIQGNSTLPSILADNYQMELKLRAEQKRLSSFFIKNDYHEVSTSILKYQCESRIHNFLQEIWQYALGATNVLPVPTKKIFISYAWPRENQEQEAWTAPFIKKLAEHLISAGIQVYIDKNDSGPGHNLREFMKKIHQIDHVLLISSRTWKHKISLPTSGVLYEYNQIQDHIKGARLQEQDFIITVILNNKNYCKNHFKEADEVSFYGQDYLNTLKKLITRVYGFGKEFDIFWKTKLLEHKILRNFWEISAENKQFVGRNQYLKDIQNIFSSSENSYAQVICHGPAGVGKTELAVQYVYQFGHYYDAVYWFNASDEDKLVESYKRLAREKNLIEEETSFSALQVMHWLENQENCLVIYDDCSFQYDLNSLIPKDGKILMTASSQCASNHSFAIQGFTRDEALEYMMRVIGQVKIDKEPEAKEQLLDIFYENNFSYLPTKWVRVCGYIQRNKLSIADFITHHENDLKRILQHNLISMRVGSSMDFFTQSMSNDTNYSVQLVRESAIVQNKALIRLNDYLLGMLQKFENWLIISALVEIHPILQQLCINIESRQSSEIEADYYLLELMLSHLESIVQYLNFSSIFIYNSREIAELEQSIKEGQLLISETSVHCRNNTNLPLTTPGIDNNSCIVMPEYDYPDIEQSRLDEQNSLHQLVDSKDNSKKMFKVFLKEIWKYALNIESNIGGYPAKKIYISFALPDGNAEQEEWTAIFIKSLTQDLICAGIQVYSNDLHLTNNGQFHDLVQQGLLFDHVLVVSSRSRKSQLGAKISTVRDEQQQIIEYYMQHAELSNKRFIIPILLNNKNYTSNKLFEGVAELSFFKDHYLKALKTLVATIYAFDKIQFNRYWKKQLISYKIVKNWWRVPDEDKYFVGRYELLQEINQFLNAYNEEYLRVVACHGMGGVGKTALAKQFVYQHCYQYSAIYWVVADNRESLIQEYVALGQGKNIFSQEEQNSSIVERAIIVKKWFENTAPEGWLLIYDNAPHYDSISDLVPVKGGKILITSCHTEWPGKCISVDVFNLEEAYYYVSQFAQDSEFSEIHQLIIMLDKHPLALAQACAYIQKKSISIIEYLTQYKIEKAKFLDEAELPGNEEHQPVAITWKIALGAVANECFDSVELIYLCAFLHNENIPCQLLSFFLDTKDMVRLEQAKRTAVEYSIVNENENNQTLSIHKLVQEVIHLQLKPRAKKEYLSKLIDIYKSNLCPDFNASASGQSLSSNPMRFYSFAHVQSLANIAIDLGFSNKALMQLYIFMNNEIKGLSLIINNKFSKNELTLAKNLTNEDDQRRYLAFAHEYIAACFLVTDVESALIHLHQAFDLRKELYANQIHWELISSYVSLGVGYLCKQDYNGACSYFEVAHNMGDTSKDFIYQSAILKTCSAGLKLCLEGLRDQEKFKKYRELFKQYATDSLSNIMNIFENPSPEIFFNVGSIEYHRIRKIYRFGFEMIVVELAKSSNNEQLPGFSSEDETFNLNSYIATISTFYKKIFEYLKKNPIEDENSRELLSNWTQLLSSFGAIFDEGIGNLTKDKDSFSTKIGRLMPILLNYNNAIFSYQKNRRDQLGIASDSEGEYFLKYFQKLLSENLSKKVNEFSEFKNQSEIRINLANNDSMCNIDQNKILLQGQLDCSVIKFSLDETIADSNCAFRALYGSTEMRNRIFNRKPVIILIKKTINEVTTRPKYEKAKRVKELIAIDIKNKFQEFSFNIWQPESYFPKKILERFEQIRSVSQDNNNIGAIDQKKLYENLIKITCRNDEIIIEYLEHYISGHTHENEILPMLGGLLDAVAECLDLQVHYWQPTSAGLRHVHSNKPLFPQGQPVHILCNGFHFDRLVIAEKASLYDLTLRLNLSKQEIEKEAYLLLVLKQFYNLDPIPETPVNIDADVIKQLAQSAQKIIDVAEKLKLFYKKLKLFYEQFPSIPSISTMFMMDYDNIDENLDQRFVLPCKKILHSCSSIEITIQSFQSKKAVFYYEHLEKLKQIREGIEFFKKYIDFLKKFQQIMLAAILEYATKIKGFFNPLTFIIYPLLTMFDEIISNLEDLNKHNQICTYIITEFPQKRELDLFCQSLNPEPYQRLTIEDEITEQYYKSITAIIGIVEQIQANTAKFKTIPSRKNFADEQLKQIDFINKSFMPFYFIGIEEIKIKLFFMKLQSSFDDACKSELKSSISEVKFSLNMISSAVEPLHELFLTGVPWAINVIQEKVDSTENLQAHEVLMQVQLTGNIMFLLDQLHKNSTVVFFILENFPSKSQLKDFMHDYFSHEIENKLFLSESPALQEHKLTKAYDKRGGLDSEEQVRFDELRRKNEKLIELDKKAIQEQDLIKAIKYYREILILSPENFTAYEVLGELYYIQALRLGVPGSNRSVPLISRLRQDAEKMFLKSLKFKSCSANNVMYGNFLYRSGDKRGAIPYFIKTIGFYDDQGLLFSKLYQLLLPNELQSIFIENNISQVIINARLLAYYLLLDVHTNFLTIPNFDKIWLPMFVNDMTKQDNYISYLLLAQGLKLLGYASAEDYFSFAQSKFADACSKSHVIISAPSHVEKDSETIALDQEQLDEMSEQIYEELFGVSGELKNETVTAYDPGLPYIESSMKKRTKKNTNTSAMTNDKTSDAILEQTLKEFEQEEREIKKSMEDFYKISKLLDSNCGGMAPAQIIPASSNVQQSNEILEEALEKFFEVEISPEIFAKQNPIGPRAISHWILKDVDDKGNCFYLAVVDQLQLINHPFIKEVPYSTNAHDSLRLRVQGEEFKDQEWAGYEEITEVCRKLDLIIAIVDTRFPNTGFICHYINEENNADSQHSPENLPNRLIARVAFTGNHYLSVRGHPKLSEGAILEPFNEQAIIQSIDSIFNESKNQTQPNFTLFSSPSLKEEEEQETESEKNEYVRKI